MQINQVGLLDEIEDRSLIFQINVDFFGHILRHNFLKTIFEGKFLWKNLRARPTKTVLEVIIKT